MTSTKKFKKVGSNTFLQNVLQILIVQLSVNMSS